MNSRYSITSSKAHNLILVLLAVAVLTCIPTSKNSGQGGKATLIIQPAPSNPSFTWANPDSTGLQVFAVDLIVSRPVENLVIHHVMPWLQEIKDGVYSDPGIISLSLYANTKGRDFGHRDTYLVETRHCEGARSPYTNVNIPFHRMSQIFRTVRLFFVIDAFDAEDLYHGKEYHFHLGVKDVHVQPKQSVVVTGSATSGTLKIDLHPPEIFIYYPKIAGEVTFADQFWVGGVIFDPDLFPIASAQVKVDGTPYALSLDTQGLFSKLVTMPTLGPKEVAREIDLEFSAIDNSGATSTVLKKIFRYCRFIPSEVLVCFNEGVDENQISSVNSTIGAHIIDFFPSIRVHRIGIPDSLALADALAYFNGLTTLVDYAHENKLAPLSWTPNDKLYTLQMTGHSAMNVQEAWDIQKGSRDVVVAIFDSGMDTSHPDLTANIWINKDEFPSWFVTGPFQIVDIPDPSTLQPDGVITLWDLNQAPNLANIQAATVVWNTGFPTHPDFPKTWDRNSNGIVEGEDLVSGTVYRARSSIFEDGIDNDINASRAKNYTDDLVGYSFSSLSNDVPNNFPTDTLGHGTMTAGIIGAEGDTTNTLPTSKGIAGVCMRVRMMPLKCTLTNPVTVTPPPHTIFEELVSEADAITAAEYAMDRGAQVFCMPFGQFWHTGWNYTAGTVQSFENLLGKLSSRGILVVTSAGNGDRQKALPPPPTPIGYNQMDVDNYWIGTTKALLWPGGVSGDNLLCTTAVNLGSEGIGGRGRTAYYWTWVFSPTPRGSGFQHSVAANFGAQTVDLAAPGVWKDSYTTHPTIATYPFSGWQGVPIANTGPGTYGVITGASAATAYTAGVAALLYSEALSQGINLTGEGARDILMGSAVQMLAGPKVNNTNPEPPIIGNTVTGGVVNALNALNALSAGFIVTGTEGLSLGRTRLTFWDVYNPHRIETQPWSLFEPFGHGDISGASVACGDVDGDGIDELIIGSGKDTGTVVQVYKVGPTRGSVLWSQFFPFGTTISTNDARCGVNVACCDLDQDGSDEILTSPWKDDSYSRYVKIVKTWDCDTSGNISPHSNFIPYVSLEYYNKGIYIACGDVNANGFKDIIVGPGEEFEPHVQIWEYNPSSGYSQILGIDVTGRHNLQGMRVGCGNIDGSGGDEIFVVNGNGNGGGNPALWVYRYPNTDAIYHTVLDYGLLSDLFVTGGDVTGDARDEIIVGYGAERFVWTVLGKLYLPYPAVNIYSETTSGLSLNRTFLANETDFQGGVTLAVGRFAGAPR